MKLENGDLALENGEFKLVDGIEEIVQSAKICTSTNKGEWFLDPEFGFDFFAVLGKNPTEGQIRGALLDAFSKESRIDTIEELTVDREGRYLKIFYKAILIDGTSIESEVEPGVK